ncbi:hypothetical protein IWT25_00786 [Secundilactobacillus pentosiphilus]|uniref:Holin n=1 Tax=Secundilactobacillus pentosiphilus TaxID=1714682 RepID=A0A1Z5IUN7_9LACO|nr:phage holin, LLH family [Secundilactobacillus pentosiphilus]GAX05480.1 hypothetical protein IWT25_00786 [Secundilactobacillus pentosiphilus]
MQHAFEVLSDSGLLDTILIGILTVVVIPLIQQLFKSAKTTNTANAYSTLDKLAEGAVAKLATQYDLPTGVKHDQALQTIQTQLAKKGIKSIDTKDIDFAIEKAYQYFTSLNTKAQAKQAVIDEGAANADSVSATKVDAATIQNAVVPVAEAGQATEPTGYGTKQAEIENLQAAIEKAQAKLTELQGSEPNA